MKTTTHNTDILSTLEAPTSVMLPIKILRAIAVGLLIATYVLIMLPFYPLLKLAPAFTRKHILIPALSLCCSILLRIMGFKITKKGDFNVNDGTVVVANHLSFMDIMLLTSVVKSTFVSTVEVQQTPFIGQLVELSGAIFIERRNRDNLKKEVDWVKSNLEDGINMSFFPEAKSTNGDELHRFRRPFFAPATDRNMDIQTVAINYDTLNGETEVDATNRHKVLWYKQNKIFAQVWNLLSYKSIEVSLHGEIVKASDYNTSEQHPADLCHDVVAKKAKLYNYIARK